MLKGCRGCRHYRPSQLAQVLDQCVSPLLNEKEIDWATGEVYSVPVPISQCRQSERMCGREARWFCSKKEY